MNDVRTFSTKPEITPEEQQIFQVEFHPVMRNVQRLVAINDEDFNNLLQQIDEVFGLAREQELWNSSDEIAA